MDDLRYALNAFIVIYNMLLQTFFGRPPLLAKIPGLQAQQKQLKEAFRLRFLPCIAAYVTARAGSSRSAFKLTSQEENGLYNCVCAAEAKGCVIVKLNDLVQRRTLTSIMDWCDQHPMSGRTVQMMTVISHIAHQNNDAYARQRALNKARPLRSETSLSAAGVRLLTSYAGTKRFSKLFLDLKRIVDNEEKRFDVTRTKLATIFVSAIATLIAIVAPMTLELLYSARFDGAEREGRFGKRPTLALAGGHDKIETQLFEDLQLCLDLIYEKYTVVVSHPVSLFTTSTGKIRDKALVVSSLELVLRKVDPIVVGDGVVLPYLTVHDLRDLGVAQLLAQGDDFLKISTVARISERAARERFSGLKLEAVMNWRQVEPRFSA